MTQRRSRPSRVRRLAVVTAVVMAPLMALGVAWRVALDRVPEPRADPPVVEMAAADMASADMAAADAQPTGPVPEQRSTALMSFRRTPGPLAEATAAARFAALIDPVLEQITAESCAVATLDSETVLSVNSEFTASTGSAQHLVVGAVALELLGAATVFRTLVMGPPPVDGVIQGDVFLIGGGDPVLRSMGAELGPERVAVAAPTSFEALADQLIEAGVGRIEGDLVGDGTRYDSEFIPTSWDQSVTREVAGPISALLANEGRLFGSGYGLNPAQAAAGELNRLLNARGVAITGRNRSGQAPTTDVVELASVESAPVSRIVSHVFDTADHTVAEMLLKEIGVVANGDGSRGGGLRAIEEQLRRWGIRYVDEALIDGSGLSEGNQLSCSLLAGILAAQGADSELPGLLPAVVPGSPLGVLLAGRAVSESLRGLSASVGTSHTLIAQTPSSDGRQIEVTLIAAEVGDGRLVRPRWWRDLLDAVAQYPVGVSYEQFAPQVG